VAGGRYTVPRTREGWPARGDPARGIDPALRGEAAWSHPAAVEWRRWVSLAWRPRGGLVLLTPCSNVKPYPRSPQSGKVRGVLRRLGLWDPGGPGYKGAPTGLDWVYLSDLLGLVPYERAHEYPPCCYEYPPSLLHSSPARLLELASTLAPALERAAGGGAVVVAYLPRGHRRLLEEALSRARMAPRVEWVAYSLFRGHRLLEEALRRLVG
jgi:predicted RNA-binding protein